MTVTPRQVLLELAEMLSLTPAACLDYFDAIYLRDDLDGARISPQSRTNLPRARTARHDRARRGAAHGAMQTHARRQARPWLCSLPITCCSPRRCERTRSRAPDHDKHVTVM